MENQEIAPNTNIAKDKPILIEPKKASMLKMGFFSKFFMESLAICFWSYLVIKIFYF